MLTRLYVDNYRCLVNFEFRPGPKQLIIGTNGTGKSTVLDVLSLLRDFSAVGSSCDARLGGATRTRWQAVRPQSFELEVTVQEAQFRYKLVVDEAGTPARPRVRTESVDCDGKPVFTFELGMVHLFNDRHEDKVQYEFDWHRSGLATVFERPDNTKLTSFKRWLKNLVHVQLNPWAMSSRSEHEAREPSRDLGNFADWFRHLKLEDGRAVVEAVAEVAQAIPGLEALEAKEAGLDVRIVQAEFAQRPGDRSDNGAGNGDGSGGRRDSQRLVIPLHDLSEGQRALIALYVIKHCAIKPDATVLIDEPDNFIALAELQPWLLGLLDRIDEQGAQVIFVSHHPELLNQLAARGGCMFDRPDGYQTRVSQFPEDADSGLSPAELVARGWERA